MKVVLVSTYERKGGAAIACYRLKEALLKEGVDVMLLTAYKTSDDPTVITPFDTRWKRLKNRFHFYKERFSIFIKNGFSRKNLLPIRERIFPLFRSSGRPILFIYIGLIKDFYLFRIYIN